MVANAESRHAFLTPPLWTFCATQREADSSNVRYIQSRKQKKQPIKNDPLTNFTLPSFPNRTPSRSSRRPFPHVRRAWARLIPRQIRPRRMPRGLIRLAHWSAAKAREKATLGMCASGRVVVWRRRRRRPRWLKSCLYRSCTCRERLCIFTGKKPQAAGRSWRFCACFGLATRGLCCVVLLSCGVPSSREVSSWDGWFLYSGGWAA